MGSSTSGVWALALLLVSAVLNVGQVLVLAWLARKQGQRRWYDHERDERVARTWRGTDGIIR